MSALQVRVFELSRLIRDDALNAFVQFCDCNDRGLGWAGLERAQYRVRLSEVSGFHELKATWTVAQSCLDPVGLIEGLVRLWEQNFELALVKSPAEGLTEWRVIHSYFGNDRQDVRSPMMDAVVAKAFVSEPACFKILRDNCAKHRLPPISLSAQDGNLLKNLLTMVGAKKGVEVGTLGGYSAAWICEAIGPAGMLVTIEKDAKRSRLAADNLRQLGFGDRVECRSGDAAKVLQNLSSQAPWDFVFIDADKASYGHYVEWAMNSVKPGGLIIADNAYLWGGMLNFPNAWEAGQCRIDDARVRLHGFDMADYNGMSAAWNMLSLSKDFDTWMLPVPDGILVARKRME